MSEKNEKMETYIAENYPDGDIVTIDCCDDCNEWTVGQHRCSCGNRRMYLQWDEDCGFAYPCAD